jgi:hypothetical protein
MALKITYNLSEKTVTVSGLRSELEVEVLAQEIAEEYSTDAPTPTTEV